MVGAGVVRRQVVAMVLGVAGGSLLFVLGLVVAAVVTSATRPTPDADGAVPLPVPALVLLVLAAAVIFWGFWRVMRLGRAAALARGEDPDAAPRLTWRTVISPRGLARYLFVARESRASEDVLVGRLSTARSWVGLVVVLSVIAWFDITALAGAVEGAMISSWNLLVVSSAVVVLVTAALAVLVPASDRGAAMRSLLRPLGVLAVFWLLAGAVGLLGSAVDGGSQLGDDAGAGEVAVALVLLAGLVWVITFAVLSARYAAGNAFRSVEAHPALPPLITLLVTWAFVGISLLAPLVTVPFLVEEAARPIPQTWNTVLTWSGVATVSALAVVELVRLARQGHRLPHGPWA